MIDAKWAEQREARLVPLATELARSNVNVIVTEGTLATRAAMQATQTIPIVMAFTADPVGTGFVAHLARPGGNVTGLSSLAGDLSGKRLELIREVVPGSSRVAVLFNPAAPAAKAQLNEAELSAQALSLTLDLLEVRGPDDLERAGREGRAAGANLLVTTAKDRARGGLPSQAGGLPVAVLEIEFALTRGLESLEAALNRLPRRT